MVLGWKLWNGLCDFSVGIMKSAVVLLNYKNVICIAFTVEEQWVCCEWTGNAAFSSSYKQLADAISGSIFTIGANGVYCLLFTFALVMLPSLWQAEVWIGPPFLCLFVPCLPNWKTKIPRKLQIVMKVGLPNAHVTCYSWGERSASHDQSALFHLLVRAVSSL